MTKEYSRIRLNASRISLGTGNDTIDPYPLFPEEVRKILLIKKNIFEELAARYRDFRASLARQAAQTPVKLTRTAVVPPKSQTKRCSAYEPSGKDYINDYNWRRWVRVKEWFHEFGPNAQKPEKGVLIE